MGYNKQGVQWNDEMIKEKIFEVIKVLNINRMPTASEVEMVYQNSALSNVIAKHGGFLKWAAKLKLKIKSSETTIGQIFENKAAEILKSKGYRVKQMSVKSHFDILVNDILKIDIKAGNTYKLRGSWVHTIGINKKYASCDLYLIFALDREGKIGRTLIIPGVHLQLTSLNFGRDSKYNKYINRWDLIDKYLKFYENIK